MLSFEADIEFSNISKLNKAKVSLVGKLKLLHLHDLFNGRGRTVLISTVSFDKLADFGHRDLFPHQAVVLPSCSILSTRLDSSECLVV